MQDFVFTNYKYIFAQNENDMNKVTVMITLDAKSQEEKKSIFLAVRHERKTKQYSLGINTKLTKHEFNNPRLKITKDVLEQARPYQVKAESIFKTARTHST